jgi:hypothetical protein
MNTIGRGQTKAALRSISVTVTATATTYTASSGGLPIDLTPILNNVGGGAPEFSVPYINPSDVVGIIPTQLSTNGYLPMNLVIGTPTYQTATFPFEPGGAGQTVRPAQMLLTCPATIQLWGTGAASAAALGQVANGAVTDAVTFLLLVCESGPNT